MDALDPTSRLIVSWFVSPGRNIEYTIEFLSDLQSRLKYRVQISTDGNTPYIDAVYHAEMLRKATHHKQTEPTLGRLVRT